MRLFGKVDGTIDRFERASWLTMPFDLELGEASTSTGPGCRLVRGMADVPGLARGEADVFGVRRGMADVPGLVRGKAVI